jgi:hypothetical protein
MDHAEALALIEEAALEAGGLDRLMAGDTPESVALAGHLAGCDECTAALAALRRTTDALRLVAADTPSPDLRDRTLALVAAVGRPRGGSASEDVGAARVTPRERDALAWLRAGLGVRSRRFAFAAVAAAAAFALLAGASFVAADLQGQLDRTRQEAARTQQLASQVETLLKKPTARSVALVGADGAIGGEVIFDPTSQQLAVLSTVLPQPPDGKEYRCWVEEPTGRQSVGRMWFDNGLSYWSGTGRDVGEWAAGYTFGVSLEPVGQPASGAAILVGHL